MLLFYVSRLQTLMKMDTNDSKAPFSMAMLAMDMKDYVASEKYFKLAIKVRNCLHSLIIQ